MQTTDEAWAEYLDFALQPTAPAELVEAVRMAFISGRLGGLAAVGAASRRLVSDPAWNSLTRDAVEASRVQAERVNGLVAKFARISQGN